MRILFFLWRPSCARRTLTIYLLLVLTLSCGDAVILSGSPRTRAAVVAAGSQSPVQRADYAARIHAEPGILGYWRLSESSGRAAVNDVGGRNGAYVGGVRLGDGTTAPLFNGSDAYVRVNTLPVNTGALSLEGWVRTTDRPSHTMGLLGYRVSGYSRFTLDQPSGENSLHAQFVNGSGTVFDLSASLSSGVRHYIALTYDGAHTLSLAIDGAVVSSRGDASGVLGNTSDAFFIGATDEGANFFAGTLDNIAVYRVALDRAVMQSHFSLGTGGGSLTATPAATSTPAPSGSVYYVSPNGSDTNPGTQVVPWRSLNKAMATLTAGQTAIFADGTYTVTSQANTGHAGAANAPITIKAASHGGARVMFIGMQGVWGKLHIIHPYWTVQDFDITEDSKGTDTTDVLVFADKNNGWNPTHATIRGNIAHGAYEKCYKFYGADDALVDGNVCYDITHDGIDFVNTDGVTVSNNELYHIGRTAMFFKGGTRNVRVFNNYYHEDGNYTSGYPDLPNGIQLGDETDANASWNPSGYEGYNEAAFNNVVVSTNGVHIGYGLSFWGVTDSLFAYNVVSGVRTGAMARSVPDTKNKNSPWPQDPKTNNARFMNNIVTGCTAATEWNTGGMSGTFLSDYNDWYGNTYATPTEPHSKTTSPLLTADWHLGAGSPVIGAGAAVTFTDLAGVAYDLTRDRAGASRGNPPSMGNYA